VSLFFLIFKGKAVGKYLRHYALPRGEKVAEKISKKKK
jgi:hypothetical protein